MYIYLLFIQALYNTNNICCLFHKITHIILESGIKTIVNVTMFSASVIHRILQHKHLSKTNIYHTQNSTTEACVQNKLISYIPVILHQLKTRFNTASVWLQSGLSYILHEEKSSESSRGPGRFGSPW